jgi:hypothetical protein
MPAITTALAWVLLLSFCVLGSVGGLIPVASASENVPIHPTLSPFSTNHVSSIDELSGSNDQNLCPSSGPTILGIQWNCVAILNLTEVALILAGIGVVLYVFRDSDEAELPGEAAEVPVTAEEEEQYQRNRSLGLPFRPSEAPPGGDEK